MVFKKSNPSSIQANKVEERAPSTPPSSSKLGLPFFEQKETSTKTPRTDGNHSGIFLSYHEVLAFPDSHLNLCYYPRSCPQATFLILVSSHTMATMTEFFLSLVIILIVWYSNKRPQTVRFYDHSLYISQRTNGHRVMRS